MFDCRYDRIRYLRELHNSGNALVIVTRGLKERGRESERVRQRKINKIIDFSRVARLKFAKCDRERVESNFTWDATGRDETRLE